MRSVSQQIYPMLEARRRSSVPGTLAAIGMAYLSLVASALAQTEVGQETAIWVQRVESAEQAKLYQAELYLSLYNSGRLATRSVEVEGDPATLAEVLHRYQMWIGETSQTIDALACDLNPELCSRVRVAVDTKTLSDYRQHVGGYDIEQPAVWGSLKGKTLRLPAISILQTYEAEPASSSYLSEPLPAAQVEPVANACTKEAAPLCFSDYATSATAALPTAALRPVLVTKERPTSDLPWNKVLNVAYVPRLAARVPLPTQPVEQWQLAPDYLAKIIDLDGLKSILKRSLVFAAPLSPENYAFDGLEAEPGYPQHQRDLFKHYCNIIEHGACPPLPANSTIPLVVAVVDRLPDLSHCDLGGQTFVMIDPANPADLRLVESEVAEVMSDCDGPPVAPLEENHGTHIVGMLGARKNDHGIVSLTAARDNIHLVVVPYDEAASRAEPEYLVRLADALARASREGTDIFNLSLTFPALSPGDPIRKLIDANKDFTLFVAAAGKQGLNANEGFCSASPACLSAAFPNLISVVGIEWENGRPRLLRGKNGEVATNFGSQNFTILAPGKDILSTVDGDGYAKMTGTSQATAVVTAAAALLMQSTNLQPERVKDRLVFSSALFPDLLDSAFGGVVDLGAALMTKSDRLKDTKGCIWFGQALRIVSADTGEPANDIPILEQDTNAPKYLAFPQVRRLHRNGDAEIVVYFYESAGSPQLRRQVTEYAIRPETRILVFEVTESPNCTATGNRMEVSLAQVADYMSDGVD